MKPDRESILVLAVTVAAILVVTARTPAARLDDSREQKVKEAAGDRNHERDEALTPRGR